MQEFRERCGISEVVLNVFMVFLFLFFYLQ